MATLGQKDGHLQATAVDMLKHGYNRRANLDRELETTSMHLLDPHLGVDISCSVIYGKYLPFRDVFVLAPERYNVHATIIGTSVKGSYRLSK